MSDKEKLYETMGELLYVIAMSDGVIQAQEKETMKELLKGHAWADEIKWSFDYEESKEGNINDLYDKVIAVCHRIGPSPLYNEFIGSMKAVAQASDGIDKGESEIINSFSSDLIQRFQNEIEKFNK